MSGTRSIKVCHFFIIYYLSYPFWIIFTCHGSSDRWILVGRLRIPRAYLFIPLMSDNYTLLEAFLFLYIRLHKLPPTVSPESPHILWDRWVRDAFLLKKQELFLPDLYGKGRWDSRNEYVLRLQKHRGADGKALLWFHTFRRGEGFSRSPSNRKGHLFEGHIPVWYRRLQRRVLQAGDEGRTVSEGPRDSESETASFQGVFWPYKVFRKWDNKVQAGSGCYKLKETY